MKLSFAFREKLARLRTILRFGLLKPIQPSLAWCRAWLDAIEGSGGTTECARVWVLFSHVRLVLPALWFIEDVSTTLELLVPSGAGFSA